MLELRNPKNVGVTMCVPEPKWVSPSRGQIEPDLFALLMMKHQVERTLGLALLGTKVGTSFKIWSLLDGVQGRRLDSCKAQILPNAAMHTHTSMADNDGDVDKSVDNPYYTTAEWRKLSKAKRRGLVRKRKNRDEGKGKGKGK